MKKMIAIMMICVSSILMAPAQAQTSFATQIGTKLITSVLGALIGKGFSSIFDSGPDPVTAQELADALNNSFKSAKLDSIHADVLALKSKIRAYQHHASIDSRRNQIDDITDIADGIRSAIQIQIHHGALLELLPDYITATNVWLAFKGERKWVSLDEGASESDIARSHAEVNGIVLSEAINALRSLNEFYYHDFVDTAGRTCIYKQPEQPWYNQTGGMISETIGVYKSRQLDVTKRYCKDESFKYLVGSGFMRFEQMFSDQYIKNFRVFKIPNTNQWFFTVYRGVGKDRNAFSLNGPFDSQAEAEKMRVWRSVLVYSKFVGDVPGTGRKWEELAIKLAPHDGKPENDAQIIHDAKAESHKLGAR